MPKNPALEPMSEMLRAEVQNELAAAGAVQPRETANLFYTWAKGRVHEDDQRRAVGLDLIPEFKEANAAQFRAVDPTPAPDAAKDALHTELPAKPKRWMVDIEREQNVPVGISSYTFRPRQMITDPYIKALADEHNIELIEK